MKVNLSLLVISNWLAPLGLLLTAIVLVARGQTPIGAGQSAANRRIPCEDGGPVNSHEDYNDTWADRKLRWLVEELHHSAVRRKVKGKMRKKNFIFQFVESALEKFFFDFFSSCFLTDRVFFHIFWKKVYSVTYAYTAIDTFVSTDMTYEWPYVHTIKVLVTFFSLFFPWFQFIIFFVFLSVEFKVSILDLWGSTVRLFFAAFELVFCWKYDNFWSSCFILMEEFIQYRVLGSMWDWIGVYG